MKKIFFTIVGVKYRYGDKVLKPEMAVRVVKEPDNKADREAIRAELEGLGRIGYVANSTHTVIGESYSAGRLYDKIGDTAEGTVLYILPHGVLCSLNPETLLDK
ncbi:MAG: HIRAN domain-containing protein [Thermoguttaceae bacterium]|nr:HIRAN domain-containing protein [Thermoguttaceae bacterium]